MDRESKSFKLSGQFSQLRHVSEACHHMQRLIKLLKPRWLRIGGYWYPQGGMPIDSGKL
jgi:7-cyano-7-deazaguanine reductase